MIGSIGDLLNSSPGPSLAAILLVAGLALLMLGGHWVVDGSVRIAERLGISTLIIGLTVVAFGTSAPELALNIIAALSGSSKLSFGNVIGSNIANIGLVIGISAVILPLYVTSKVLRREMPLMVLATVLTICLGALGLVLPGTGGFAGFGWIQGLVLTLCFVFCAILWVRQGLGDRKDKLVEEARNLVSQDEPASIWPGFWLCLLGLLALIIGGKLTETGAVGLAQWWGLSDELIGLTIVAVATSLPEISTSLTALKRNQPDLAVGNVVGSNLFNLLLVLGVTAFAGVVPIPMPFGWWDLGAMLVFTIILVPIAISGPARITRAEGITLLVMYAAYITWSILREI